MRPEAEDEQQIEALIAEQVHQKLQVILEGEMANALHEFVDKASLSPSPPSVACCCLQHHAVSNMLCMLDLAFLAVRGDDSHQGQVKQYSVAPGHHCAIGKSDGLHQAAIESGLHAQSSSQCLSRLWLWSLQSSKDWRSCRMTSRHWRAACRGAWRLCTGQWWEARPLTRAACQTMRWWPCWTATSLNDAAPTR